RERGFVSNRIFDALACGTPVISDPVPGLADLFGDAVVTADDPTTLRAAVDAILADPVGARSRAARGGAIVRAEHTFAHRAEQLVDALRRHGRTAQPEAG
ncbi:MAG: glycosyltransferase, partial [Actinomycetota bacterium]